MSLVMTIQFSRTISCNRLRRSTPVSYETSYLLLCQFAG